MKPDIEELRRKYIETPPEGMTSADIRHMSEEDLLDMDYFLNDDELDFLSDDCQRINRWKFFLSEEQNLGKGWGINYGAVYTTSIEHSHQ